MAEVTQLYAKTSSRLGLDAKVFALNLKTVDLCLSVFPWAEFRSAKAAVKVHTLLDVYTEIPDFILIFTGKTRDVNILDEITFVKNVFYVMDLAYLGFARLYKINQVGTFFIVREKKSTKLRRLYSCTTDKTIGVRCDQIVCPAETIAALCKRRQEIKSFSNDQAKPSRPDLFRPYGKRGEAPALAGDSRIFRKTAAIGESSRPFRTRFPRARVEQDDQISLFFIFSLSRINLPQNSDWVRTVSLFFDFPAEWVRTASRVASSALRNDVFPASAS